MPVPDPAPVPLQGSAFVGNLLAFVAGLRRLGVSVSPQQSQNLLAGLSLIDIADQRAVYWVARSLLITRREDLQLFDAWFGRFFRPAGPATEGRRQPRKRSPPHRRRFSLASWLEKGARPGAESRSVEQEVVDRSLAYSATESLRSKDFASMNDDELDAVRRLMTALRLDVSRRRTRRWERGQGSRLDLRSALRESSRHGGYVFSLRFREPRVKERPIVLLADISGSMERYSRLLLQFFFCVSHALPRVETFVFGTRLTRITPELKLRNVDRALGSASRRVIDWAGGTRIGDSLGDFNRHWSRRVLRRGAVVLLASDGWERGGADRLRHEMQFLQRRCHRLIWLNPLLGQASYQPRVEGMAAALPYVDDFLPVHNLRSLEQLSAHLRALPEQRNARRQGAGYTLAKSPVDEWRPQGPGSAVDENHSTDERH